MLNKIVQTIFLLFVFSCGQTYNSNTLDGSLSLLGSFCSDTSDTKLCTANEIIFDQCVNCHTNRHNDWAGYKTNADWINSGNVVPGNPDTSPLITRLQNVGSNMPIGKPALSEVDYQALRDWISGL